MRRLLAVLVTTAAIACTTSARPGATPRDPPNPADERCARDTFVALVTAVNKGNRGVLTSLVSGEFMSLTLWGSTTYERRDAVERLLTISGSKEQWEIRHFDVNGRGSRGGVDFGVVIRRTGPGVPEPFRDWAGKGVLGCPAGGVMIFGLGGD
jgi:hypothetical protein